MSYTLKTIVNGINLSFSGENHRSSSQENESDDNRDKEKKGNRLITSVKQHINKG